ncbi:hypothetical protein HO133_006741 [Letharia lupina]|uniref:Glycosyltransferase family 34 protein n=1 Tax=Letharia lupina TaxID=560253 RepID=A0A8H6F7L7_9LECA|nr:uncharacterized protein HO133_006741 [Letharia lupina]KAF6217639.1 hypothetical protein HO133_006741 [Letharia lupina]
MLGAGMLGTSPKHLAALMFCAIPIFFFFFFFHTPTSWDSSSTIPPSKPSNPWSSIALAIEDTKDLADQRDIFDSTLEGGARIRQACMLFSSEDTAHQMGANAVYERSVRTHLKHAEKWGYPSHILREDIIGHGKWEVLVFGKLLYLQSIIIAELTKPIGKRAEWIVWFDADTIILNENIPWSIFLPPREDFNDIHFLGNKDWHSFNCGLFMMRINEWSVNFLIQATALPLLRPDVPLGVPIPNMEQDAMRWVLDQEGYKEHAVYQPRLWYNTFAQGPDKEPETKMGDMLIHFPGVEHKYPLMGHWLDIVENEPEKVNIPLANLTLHSNIKGFWANLRTAKQALHNATEYTTADVIVQQVFNKHPELGDELKETSKRLERLVYEEPFQQKELKEATLLVDAALSRASNARAEAERHEAQQKEQAKVKEEKKKEEKEEEKKQQEEKEKKEQQAKQTKQAKEQQQKAGQGDKQAEDQQQGYH